MSVAMEPSGSGVTQDRGRRGKYPPCSCCPYGYHIDLDFVRYCEALSQGSEVSASKQRRRERRRQRHSMEVLLGLTSPSLWSIEQQLPQIPQEEITSPGSNDAVVRDALSKAVEVFEDTLQRSHKAATSPQDSHSSYRNDEQESHTSYRNDDQESRTSYRNDEQNSRTSYRNDEQESRTSYRNDGQESQQDGLGTEEESFSMLRLSAPGTADEHEAITTALSMLQDFDVASVGSAASGVSTGTLQNIREQMAVSLERMRELEEQAKLVPILQVQLAVLKEEKRKLLLQQKLEESGANKCKVGTVELRGALKNDLKVATQNHKDQTCSFCLTSNYRQDYNGSTQIEPIQDYKISLRERSHSLSGRMPKAVDVECSTIISNTETKPLKMAVRDKGVACSVVTREVGISHQQPKMRNTGTSTLSVRDHLSFSQVWSDNISPDPLCSTMRSAEASSTRQQTGKPISESTEDHFQGYKPFHVHKLSKSSLELLNVAQCPLKNACINTDLRMNYVYTEDDLDQSVSKAVKLHEKYYLNKLPEMTTGQTQTINQVKKPILQIVERSDLGIQVDQSSLCRDAAIQCEPCVQQNGIAVQSESSLWTRDAEVQYDAAEYKQDTGVQWDTMFWQSTAVTQCEPSLWQQDAAVQVEEPLKRRFEVGVMAKPRYAEASVEVKPIMRDRGCSDCTVKDILCDRCKVKKRSIGVGCWNINSPMSMSDTSVDELSLLSSSFLQQEADTVDVPHIDFNNKEMTTICVGSHRETITYDTKATDTADLMIGRTREIAINTLRKHFSDASVGSVTEYQSRVNGESNMCTTCGSTNASVEKDIVQSGENQTQPQSRIPRLTSCIPIAVNAETSSHIPNPPTVSTTPAVSVTHSTQLHAVTTTQSSDSLSSSTRVVRALSPSTKKITTTSISQSLVSNLKERPSAETSMTTIERTQRLKRQNTYTKLSEVTENSNLHVKSDTTSAEEDTKWTSVTNSKHQDVQAEQTMTDEEEWLRISPSAVLSDRLKIKSESSDEWMDDKTMERVEPPRGERFTRAEPSKEMKAAMKVINDYLTKSPTKKDLPHHLTNAANIVQQEWFKVSGGKTVNPLAVEDYLDYIEGYSSALLEHVVNMTDMSGNTALHYAVSSGNFDVVSILLDSKVCNVNKRNAAGYTCVMLATLVKLRSETHRQIIRRMFLLADVNLKAKPHGQTALMLATSHGSLEMVEMLTEAGADMNIQDADGSTALMCAADHGFADIVKHIISQPDCDVSITDSDGCSALNIAMESGNRHIGLLLYAHEHFSRGSSPHGSMRQRSSRSTTPTPKCNTLPTGRSSSSPVTVCEQPEKSL